MSSTVAILESPTGPDRRVPTWAAGLVAGLSRDLPTVVTRDDLAGRLVEVGADRTVDSAVHELRRLGWLVTLPLHGVWGFVPPGVGEVLDPTLVCGLGALVTPMLASCSAARRPLGISATSIAIPAHR